MAEHTGFDVRPEALRAVAAGLRDEVGPVRAAAGVVEDAVTPVHGAGDALAGAVSELARVLVRAAGGARRDLEDLAGSLQATALGYQADDHRGSASFGGILSRRIPP